MPKLRIKQGNLWKDLSLDKDVFRIGRDSKSDYVIDSSFVSRNHCEIIHEDGAFTIRDLGSNMGTRVNGHPVTRQPLQFGDKINLSNKFKAVFVEGAEDVDVSNTDTLRYVEASAQGATERLVGLDGPLANRVFFMDREITRIGRETSNDLCIQVDTVSRYHAELIRREDRFLLIDKNSGNGTYVGDRRIRKQVLRSGDLVRFDWVTFRFEDEQFRSDHGGTRLSGIFNHETVKGDTEDLSRQTDPLGRQLLRDPELGKPATGRNRQRSQRLPWLLFGLMLLFIAAALAMVAYLLYRQGYLTTLLGSFLVLLPCGNSIAYDRSPQSRR